MLRGEKWCQFEEERTAEGVFVGKGETAHQLQLVEEKEKCWLEISLEVFGKGPFPNVQRRRDEVSVREI